MEAPVEIDKSDPENIINLLPRKFQDCIEKLYLAHPEYLGASEEYMYNVLRPDSRTDMIRISFWEEYFRAKTAGNKMQLKWVFGDLMDHKNFYRDFLNKEDRLAWIMTPMTERMLSYKASLDAGRRQLKKILSSDIFDEDGNLDTRKAAIFLKAYEMMESRVHGALIQRIDQRTQVISTKESDALERKIESIQEKLLDEASTVLSIEGDKNGD